MTQATNAQATQKERQKTKPKSVVSVPAKISATLNDRGQLVLLVKASWSLPNGQVAETNIVSQPVDLSQGGALIEVKDLPLRMQIA